MTFQVHEPCRFRWTEEPATAKGIRYEYIIHECIRAPHPNPSSNSGERIHICACGKRKRVRLRTGSVA